MDVMEVMLDPGAYLPTRAHSTDAGLDLYAKEDKEVPPYGSAVFDTGVHLAIPEGYVGDVKSKSGLMVLHDITTDGTVDPGYTGSILVRLFNSSPLRKDIKAGQKIAQIVLKKILIPELKVVNSLEPTERGSKGFGSSGAF